jgi:hypothetical protein
MILKALQPKTQIRCTVGLAVIEALFLYSTFQLATKESGETMFHLFTNGMIGFPVAAILWLAYVVVSNKPNPTSGWVILLSVLGIVGPIILIFYMLSSLH